MEAYVHGTSTREVDDLVKALGVEAGISKSEVSRVGAELDGEVAAFRSPPCQPLVRRLPCWNR
jgi:putative transposase